ncbi:MAG: hydrogenase-1 expression HyaE [Thiomicrorhabdus sp.]|nr:hydrogenase-1 expression HyaE [Thiomicrorhabdus sp.]
MPRTLIQQITEQQNYPVLNSDNYDSFVKEQEYSVIFFAGDPKRYPETNDVVIVLPELEKAFQGQFTVAVVDENSERALAKKYGFTMWPALVFLKKGAYLDVLTRIQDWSDYMNEIPIILEKQPNYAPSIGISVEIK